MKGYQRIPALCAVMLLGSGAAHGETREHGAHVHGTARMDVARVGDELAVDFYSPAMNIVGFEHAPGTDEQRRMLQDALETLSATERMFSLPEAAGCVASHVDATRIVGDEHDEHDGHDGHDGHDADEHGDGDGERHSEIQASWRFECNAPAELDGIQVHLFKHFPTTEYLRVQVLTDSAQRALVLTPDNTRVPF